MNNNKDINKYSPKRRLGNLAEDVACIFLKKHGFRIIHRNYLQKWGEIDIIATKEGLWHFIEVKSVTRETRSRVSQKTSEQFRPEENLHKMKLEKIARTAQIYMLKEGMDRVEWQIDAIVVNLFIKDKCASVRCIMNVL